MNIINYDAKFSAISIKVENIYFRKTIGKKIGIKNRKKIGRKNTLDTGLQSTSQYICFPIFSYVFPICIFGLCFFLFLNPIFLIFPISEHLLPAPYLFFFLFSPIFPVFPIFSFFYIRLPKPSKNVKHTKKNRKNKQK